MLTCVRVRNFRGLRDLKVDEMARINLFAGFNNSGKTTLLEALFLLATASNPQKFSLTARGIESVAGHLESVSDVLWKPMFSEFDASKHIEISGEYTSRGKLTLRISRSRSSTTSFPREGKSPVSTTELPNYQTLAFAFENDRGRKAEGFVHLTEGGINVETSEPEPAYPAAILMSNIGSQKEDAIRLGQLRVRKQHRSVEDALRVVEPKLESIEDNSVSRHPMIWVDIGLPELLPLPMMGEGMIRVARLALAISAAPGGVVLVDEIENGLHHAVIPNVWRAIDRAAREFDTQVIATTHSFECFAAAHQALGSEGFLFHRLETKNGANRCVTYPAEAMEGAVEHGLEVR